MAEAPDAREMFKELPWPFDGDEFPPHLGAVVMRTVLSGERPAREVIHTFDNEWLVADGVNDPNALGACVATHMSHVVQRNSSVAGLANLAPGNAAFREGERESWRVEPWAGWEDEPST